MNILKYNKIVTQKRDIYAEEKLKKLQEKTRRNFRRDNVGLDRPEYVYYLWYLHLKLILEMEDQRIPIQKQRKYRSTVKQINQREVSHIHELKLKQDVYSGIDLEETKSIPWSQWKKKYLDVFKTGGVKLVDHGDSLKCEPEFMYLEVDLRNTETNLLNQFKEQLKNVRKRKLKKSNTLKVLENTRIHYHPLILGYNLLISRIEGKDFKTIYEENVSRIENQTDTVEFEGTVRSMYDKKYVQRVGFQTLYDELTGLYYFNLNRYLLDTQRVLYNVSQGRFLDKTDIPKNKWKTIPKGGWSKGINVW
jgi:hypothetical protein|tara:strand:+ start:163 stop:1080 length:918 start_codon:yes stop_codon:yes gene_type:complete